MSRFIGCADDRHPDGVEKLGILMVNLGTPDAPTRGAVRRYLAEFLSDKRVIELPFTLWKCLLHGVILRIRPARLAKNYAKIWTDDGSPLLAISRHQGQELQMRLDQQFGSGLMTVCVAMRYGNPSIEAGLRALHAQHVTRLLVLPMYPQYCAATTATVFDAVTCQLQCYRWIPELRCINDYYRHPTYINALAESIREAWRVRSRGEKLLFSFHGIPMRRTDRGDPYFYQCQTTAQRVARALQLDDDSWQLVFQSRFGFGEWLQPYCAQTLEALGRNGCRSVDIVCPGFSADCLETLEEIEVENRAVYKAAGGGEYCYIAALNARTEHIDLLEILVSQHIEGWLRKV